MAMKSPRIRRRMIRRLRTWPIDPRSGIWVPGGLGSSLMRGAKTLSILKPDDLGPNYRGNS